eukprot:362209-Chlamydomonas_euryale.AAC.3
MSDEDGVAALRDGLAEHPSLAGRFAVTLRRSECKHLVYTVRRWLFFALMELGASTCTGRLNGVAARLMKVVSHLTSAHCFAHRCALVMGEKGDSLKSHVSKRMVVIFKLVHALLQHECSATA